MKFRRVNALWAILFGYFWLPCPICGRMFGGHEWKDRGGLSSTIYRDASQPAHGSAICPVCTRAGKGERVYPVLDGEMG